MRHERHPITPAEQLPAFLYSSLQSTPVYTIHRPIGRSCPGGRPRPIRRLLMSLHHLATGLRVRNTLMAEIMCFLVQLCSHCSVRECKPVLVYMTVQECPNRRSNLEACRIMSCYEGLQADQAWTTLGCDRQCHGSSKSSDSMQSYAYRT